MKEEKFVLKKKSALSLQTRIALLVCSVVALSLLVTDFLMSEEISRTTQKNLAEKATNIARIVSHSSIVINALSKKTNEQDIQNYANELMHITQVQFIVVMDMHGIRKSHPDPNQIGKRFVGGDEGPVLHGKENVSIAKGTLGYSLRAFSPVYSEDGKQIGAVAVGISLNNVNKDVKNSRYMIYVAIVLGIIVGIIGALFLGKKVKNTMFGLEPYEIARLLEERNAMLQSTKEGIIAIDQNTCITLINSEGLRLLKEAGIVENPVGCLVDSCFPQLLLKNILETGIPKINEEIHLSNITLLSNQLPIIVGHSIVGAVATFRDKTEMNHLAEQLTGVKLYAEALRAQSHEFMNKLHVILGLVNLKHYDKLADYITFISDHLQQEVGYIVKKVKDPALAGFILGKISYARECSTELLFDGQGVLPEPHTPELTHELITILGNVVDNALEAVSGQTERRIEIFYEYLDGQLSFEVIDNGPGLSESIAKQVFMKGFSSKGTNRGYGLYLVKSSIDKLHGEIELFSTAEKGTRFIFTIPYIAKEV
ncbi:DcuS/MalK family sensor histidine kinase [Heyndrickxia acidicola]|uniref:histidine kinase n=1 Tax=Heyndrickxia acidicola TaxID=209389 RepID=A0ABU6MJH2_9BACI|nr:DcuS/MalK family sensor histidine kinase [Heyndrickxia acidicola]MED1204464.1 DcuS/MalK family sensor histidine kinase [Heyndrickxia acidicola]